MERAPFDQPDIYTPKFRITPETAILTAGSCFAQHVGRALRGTQFNVIDEEPGPPDLPPDTARRFGYGLYGARHGNIYTLRQFRQLIEEAAGVISPALPVWRRQGRFYDAQRPGVEPDGLDNVEQVLEMRKQHLGCVARALSRADVIIFTLGLTELWEHLHTHTVYPTAPGTIAGSFDAKVFGLRNLGVDDIRADFDRIQTYMKQVNPGIRWILTVSPVPLTATATDDHVLVASSRSKAILRVAADQIAANDPAVDYFPAFELSTSPAATGRAWSANLRSPSPDLIDAIMRHFLLAHGATAHALSDAPRPDTDCEDVLLEAFRT